MAWCRQATSHCWSRYRSPYHTVSLSTFKSAWKWQTIAFDTLTCMILIFSQTQPRIWGIVPTSSFCLSNTVVSRFTDTENKMLQHTRREEESTVIALYFDKNALSWFLSVCVTANISCVFGRPLQHAHYIPRLKWKGSHVDYFVVTDCTPQVHSQKTAQIAKFHGANMGPTWVLSPQMGPMLAPWTFPSGSLYLALGCELWDVFCFALCHYDMTICLQNTHTFDGRRGGEYMMFLLAYCDICVLYI